MARASTGPNSIRAPASCPSRSWPPTTEKPSFLAIHPNGKSLYCVNEIDKFAGKKSGAITAFSLDPKSGELKQLNRKPSGGPSPCHINVHPSGKFLAVANYNGGGGPDSKELTANFITVPIAADGSLAGDGTQVKYGGKSVKARQQTTHTHSVNFTPNGKCLLAADLGLDQVRLYSFTDDGSPARSYEAMTASLADHPLAIWMSN